MSVDRNKITNEEITQMIEISPNAIPLNPSQQGWSGSKVKEYMSKYIFDAEKGLIARINGKLVGVSGEIDDMDERVLSLESVSERFTNGVYATIPKVSATAPLTNEANIWIQTTSGDNVINENGEETLRYANDILYDGETIQLSNEGENNA